MFLKELDVPAHDIGAQLGLPWGVRRTPVDNHRHGYASEALAFLESLKLVAR